MTHDPRLTPARADLAAEALRGQIEAPRYVMPEPYRIAAPVVPLRPRPDTSLPPDTELLFGEGVGVLDVADNWAWVQSALDGYVGYLPADSLRPATEPEPSHRVRTLTAQAYAEPRLKSPASGTLVFGARFPVTEIRDGYARVGEALWMPEPQIVLLDHAERDWVAIAEMFLGVPYVWGGRSSRGLDCSALVQLARQGAGHTDCPRDSDMQAADLGVTLAEGAPMQRGDLIFWKGHVGILVDPLRLLHANAHHMAVTLEPLAGAVQRIEAAGDGPVTRRARLDAAP